MPPIDKKSFAAGHFSLMVDESYNQTGLVKSVEGGFLKAASTEEPMAGFHLRGKHASTREFDPLSIEFAMAGARWALSQIEAVINNREHKAVSGTLIHADINMKEQFSFAFRDARLVEATFPKCDAKSKELCTLKTKLMPEVMDFNIGAGPTMSQQPLHNEKQWQCNAFRLTLDGYKAATDWCTSVEALTFKVNAKPLQTGPFRLPEVISTKVEMPKLSFMVPLGHAAPILAWYKRAVMNTDGLADGDRYETTGSLEFLDQSKRNTVYEIDFDGVGIESIALQKSDANQAATKMLKVDCYITSVKLRAISGAPGFI
jgi:hypothetical protein